MCLSSKLERQKTVSRIPGPQLQRCCHDWPSDSQMIFLHSSFRVSSTWLWTRFRALGHVLAYYEIFHEELARITPAQILQRRPDNWESHHPPSRPYFLEFMPLVKSGGGIAGYHRDMAFRNFVAAEGVLATLREAEQFYLEYLVRHARNMGKYPVLSCTRSIGRLPAIKAAMPGLHILCYRNLFQQWCSYVDQHRKGNVYFIDTIYLTLEANPQNCFLRDLRALFLLKSPTATSDAYLICFMLLHLYLYAKASAAADLVIDVNHLAADDVYRRRTEGLIALTSGLLVNLSGAEDRCMRSFVGSIPADALAEICLPYVERILETAPNDVAQDFAARVFADFMSAYRYYMQPHETTRRRDHVDAFA